MKSGIAIDQLSEDVRPQDDLFRHVNARWLDTVEIPDDRAVHGAFHALRDQAELDVRALLEESAEASATGEGGDDASTEQRQVGDLYADFMDADRFE